MRSDRWACFGLIVFGTAIRLAQLNNPLTGSHAFRQTQTAFAIREYSRHGIDLLTTPLPVFGTQRDVPFEFPLFQAVGAMLTNLGLDASTAGRLTALLFFQVTGILAWTILRRWQPQAAILCLVLFEFLPFGLHWGATGLIDSLSTALGLAMVLGLDLWFTRGARLNLAVGSLAAWMLYLVKPTTVPTVGALLLLAAVLSARRLGWEGVRRRLFLGFLIGPGLAFLPLWLWTRHADAVKSTSPLTAVFTSAQERSWNFGTLQQRGELAPYLMIVSRLVQDSCGYLVPAVIALAVVLLARRSSRQTRPLIVGLGLAVIASPLVFFNLFYIHTYYVLGVFPVLAMFVAVVVSSVLPQRRSFALLFGCIACALILAAAFITPIGQDDFGEFLHEPPMPTEITRTTPAHAPLVMIGCDWNPALLYYSDRRGLMLRDPPKPQVWRQNQIAEYHYLYSCDPGLSDRGYLPRGTVARPTGHKGLFTLGQAAR